MCQQTERREKTSEDYGSIWASLIAHLVKNPPALQEGPILFVGVEGLLEKG